MNIVLVPVHQVDAIWPHVAAQIGEAVLATGGDVTVGHIWTQCREGAAWLIVVSDGDDLKAVSVWRHEVWLTGPKLRCMALWGRGMPEWLPQMRGIVTRIARDCGARSFVTEGRKGWERIFPKAKVLRTLYEEPIE